MLDNRRPPTRPRGLYTERWPGQLCQEARPSPFLRGRIPHTRRRPAYSYTEPARSLALTDSSPCHYLSPYPKKHLASATCKRAPVSPRVGRRKPKIFSFPTLAPGAALSPVRSIMLRVSRGVAAHEGLHAHPDTL